VPAGSAEETTCLDPTAPVPPGGNDGPELLVNGDFGSGTLLPGWTTFGQITQNVTGGVFQFYRPAGTPAGVILQPTLLTMTPGEILTASFQLGNSSFVRVRVTVIVHDNDFSDLAACTFWLPAAQPLSTYTMRLFTTKAWTNTTFSVYPSTVGNVFWTRFDNASLRRTPGAPSGGVGCFEPGAAPVAAPAPHPTRRSASGAPAVRTRAAGSEVAPANEAGTVAATGRSDRGGRRHAAPVPLVDLRVGRRAGRGQHRRRGVAHDLHRQPLGGARDGRDRSGGLRGPACVHPGRR
jgi:hypothetical protein